MFETQIPGDRCQVLSVTRHVPGTRDQVARDHVSGFRDQVPGQNFKTFTLKILYILTEIISLFANLFFIQ